MKVAQKLIFLFSGKDGFGAAIAQALYPDPNSSLRRVDQSFEFPLDKYGIPYRKASGSIVHFVDEKDVYQVSVLLVNNYELPVLVCAINEILAQLIGEASTMPTIVAPFFVAQEIVSYPFTEFGIKFPLCGLQIGPETELSSSIVKQTKKPPSSLKIFDEPLCCFLHLVRTLKVPTVVFFGVMSRSISKEALDGELEIMHEIGNLLASSCSLCFSKDHFKCDPIKKMEDSEEPWRALYG